MYTVYMHTVIENGKRYIGQCSRTAKERWGSNGHRYKGQLFYNAIKKYGWDNILHEIVAEGLTRKEADELEKELIAKYKSNDRKYGYNITEGGRNGVGSPGGKNHNARAVICLETNEIWECASYCARDLNVEQSSLNESLYHGYRCCGKHYRYLDDVNYKPNKDPYKVRCVETGEIWNSVKECAKATGKNKRTIAHYCRKERNSKDGLTYEYVA